MHTPIHASKKAVGLLVALVVFLGLARAGLGVRNGLSAEYFTNEQLAGSPAVKSVDPDISPRRFDAAWVGHPPPKFSVRWQGYITIAKAGEHLFATRSDDGSRVTIEDRLVVDNSGNHSPLTRTGRVSLDAGQHRILIEYDQDGGGYDLALLWASALDEPLTPVPPWLLSPQRASSWTLRAAWAIGWAMTMAIWAAAVQGLWLIVRSPRSSLGAAARHPRVASLLFFIVLAAIETWPLAAHPARLSRNDNNDTLLNEWVLAWVAHEAPRSPLHVYDANIFYPERDTLAYSESMIVQSAMAAPLLWLGASPVLAYNVVLLAGFVLTGWSMCLVMARWLGDWVAALLSGVLVAFNSYTMTSLPHLQALHVEFLPPALLALDTLLRERRIADAIRLAIWFALQALTSIYLLVFTAVALLAGIVVRPEAWRGPRFGRVATLVVLSAALASVALLPFLLPYWHVYHGMGVSRTIDWQQKLSANWRDYVGAPGRIHYSVWSSGMFWNTGLFPGMVGLALTAVAVGRRVAFTDSRARMCLGFGIAGIVLSFGPAVPGYALLYRLLLPLHAVRAMSRFGYLALVGVGALAGFGAVELRRLVPARRWAVLAIVLVALAAIEPLAAPLELVRFDRISPIYQQVASESKAVIAELPFYGGASSHAHAVYMLNSTSHWRPMINGYSGAEPLSFVDHINALGGFPDAQSIVALQDAGVTHVFVHTAEFPDAVVNAMSRVPALHRLDSLDGIVLYRLAPKP